MKKIIALLLVLLMVGSLLAACGKTDNTAETTAATEAKSEATVDSAPNVATADTATADSAATVADLDAVTAKGKLVVGITDYKPVDYKENGAWVGFDAELATGFAKNLGVEIEFVEIDWDNKIMELNGGTVDCIWNGMTLTDEVTSAMSCTDPYLNNAQVVVVNKNVADQYQAAEDCKGLNFAVESGSAGQKQAEANSFNFTEVKDQATALMEVASGTCDGAIVDILMAVAMTGEDSDYEQLTYTVSLNSEGLGVGFRTGSDLTAKCNEYLAAAKSDGTMNSLAETYKLQDAMIK